MLKANVFLPHYSVEDKKYPILHAQKLIEKATEFYCRKNTNSDRIIVNGKNWNNIMYSVILLGNYVLSSQNLSVIFFLQ